MPTGTPEPRAAVVAQVVLPPPDAKVVPTACDYCIVGCGYKAYIWPVGREGGPKASENALKVDFPVPVLSGKWISPNMHNIVQIDGAPHHVLVIPDGDTQVVNVRGDHSVRGGTLAQKLYNPQTPTRDRLQQPQLRVGDHLVPITWEAALDLLAQLSRYVLDRYGELAWGMKMYSYQYYENTYALTKLALAAVKTPCWAPHDKPSAGDDTPGLSDAGVDAFSAAYQDWKEAEVIYVSGVSLYETKSIAFQQWVVPGGAKLVVVNPRRDYTAAYAEKHDGLHLQLIPGTDTVLNNAIARVILENGWEDREFIGQRTVSAAELAQETPWRRRMFGMTFEQYKQFVLADDAFKAENAEKITGVPAGKIRKAAELMAGPRPEGRRPRTSLMLEKGNYWGHNYENTASFASLGLLVGAGGRPGQMISRAGGHQRGMISAAGYPMDKSADSYQGNKIELNLDRWMVEGNLRFIWVIGTTWVSAMGASQHLAQVVRRLTLETEPQLSPFEASVNLDQVKETLKARIDNGGMVLVQQEIYSNALTEFADIILPAATWGEEDFSRMQGERRLRIYSKIMNPPGQAKPDWWIVAQVAKRIGFSGFDWRDSNDVFEEAADRSRGTSHDYAALVEMARAQGKRGHEFLRQLGTTGIQCPIKLEGDQLVGTVRLHTDRFGTRSGKAVFPKGDWNNVKPFQEEFAPKGDELWVTNMRVNEHWQTQFDDARIPYRWERFPVNILEINPKDASARGIDSGDWVVVENDQVLTQTGGRQAARFKAVAYVTDQVPPGVTCSYFNFGQGRLDMAANSVTPGVTDPINNRYRFKLGKGRVRKEGESEFKDRMSFVPRNLA
jgi:arsenite oxidase large subunit